MRHLAIIFIFSIFSFSALSQYDVLVLNGKLIVGRVAYF